MTALTQAISDDDQLQRLQLAMFQSAKTIIKRHAPGLPLAVLEKYMAQLGGSVIVIDGTTIDEGGPFRVRVTVIGDRIQRIVGWG